MQKNEKTSRLKRFWNYHDWHPAYFGPIVFGFPGLLGSYFAFRKKDPIVAKKSVMLFIIFLPFIGGPLAHYLFKKVEPVYAKKYLYMGLMLTTIYLVIPILFIFYMENFTEGGFFPPDIPKEEIGNTSYAMFVMPNKEVKVAWGAVTTTNTGSIPVTIDGVASNQITMPYKNWYVDIIESELDSNFELRANKIDETGHMLDSPGLTEECGGPSIDIIRISLDENRFQPTLCLENVSDPVRLEPGQSLIIYFKTTHNRSTSLNVGEQTGMSIRTVDSRASDINFKITTQSIPS